MTPNRKPAWHAKLRQAVAWFLAVSAFFAGCWHEHHSSKEAAFILEGAGVIAVAILAARR